MAAPPSPPVNLEKLDPFSEVKQKYAQVDPLWLANLVDTYNAAITKIEVKLDEIDSRLTAGGL